jgi:hypothetical protein
MVLLVLICAAMFSVAADNFRLLLVATAALDAPEAAPAPRRNKLHY